MGVEQRGSGKTQFLRRLQNLEYDSKYVATPEITTAHMIWTHKGAFLCNVSDIYTRLLLYRALFSSTFQEAVYSHLPLCFRHRGAREGRAVGCCGQGDSAQGRVGRRNREGRRGGEGKCTRGKRIAHPLPPFNPNAQANTEETNCRERARRSFCWTRTRSTSIRAATA